MCNLNSLIKLFEDFVRYLKVNKVEVTIFLPPYNPITYDLLLESNKYNMILTAEKYLINFRYFNIALINKELGNLDSSLQWVEYAIDNAISPDSGLIITT